MTLGLIESLLSALLVAAPVVVLDPGHGGLRLGAVAQNGVAEKDVALKITKYIRADLERAGIRVVLTREKDVYVRLKFRTNLANRHHADAFISIHANSSPTSARRGCETYVLSARASDDVSLARIQIENEDEEPIKFVNEAQFGGGSHKRGVVDTILADLKRGTSHGRSARLAKFLQEAMSGVNALSPSRGLRQAPFKVLKGAKMPAALVEIGYLTHPVQSRSLGLKKTQREIGRALAQGILAYLKMSSTR
jgi:N-acetylmuramoyl-L-alanine amidase